MKPLVGPETTVLRYKTESMPFPNSLRELGQGSVIGGLCENRELRGRAGPYSSRRFCAFGGDW